MHLEVAKVLLFCRCVVEDIDILVVVDWCRLVTWLKRLIVLVRLLLVRNYWLDRIVVLIQDVCAVGGVIDEYGVGIVAG